MHSTSIALVAGRSGGHIIPAMTYAEDYKKKHADARILFFSTDYYLDRAIIELYPWITTYVPLALINFPGLNLLRYPLFVFQFLKCFFKSLYQLYYYKPVKLVSMGGYISIPVALASKCLGIPVVLFELNAVPGRASFQIARLAEKVHVCFKEALPYFSNTKVVYTPYPLRFTSNDRIGRREACLALGIDPTQKVLLVLGGSQGSRYINNLLTDIAKNYVTKHPQIQVIHQTGAIDVAPLQIMYQNHTIVSHVFDYRKDLGLCYEAADIIIARAGAGTIFEIAFFEKPGILIPLVTRTTDHQTINAEAIAQQYPGKFYVVMQKEAQDETSAACIAILKKYLY